MKTRLLFKKHMWDLFLFSFSLARRKNSRFRALRRSCEIGRAGNANFATAGSAGKKKQKRKGPETAPWPVSITRLLWLRQWRTLFLAEDVLSASLPLTVLLSCSRRSATASETAQREHCRSRLNGFLASRSTPLSPRFPHSSLPFFLLVLLRVPLVVPPAPPLLTTRKFTRPLRSDRLGTSPWTVFESTLLFNFASVSRPYLHPCS